MFHVTQRVSRNEFHETSPRNVNWFIVRVVAIMLGVSRYCADLLCSENVTIMLKEHHACSISIPPPPKKYVTSMNRPQFWVVASICKNRQKTEQI